MTNKGKESKRVVAATLLAIGLLLLVPSFVSWVHVSQRPRGDSADHLAQDSFDAEKASLKQQAQGLGNTPSAETINAQWDVLRWQMLQQGATAEAANQVLARAHSWKNSIEGATSSLDLPLWPLVVDAAYVKERPVWVIHLAYWDSTVYPSSSTSAGLRCGTDAEFRRLAYRTCVVDNEAPYRCWMTPFQLQLRSTEEKKSTLWTNEIVHGEQGDFPSLILLNPSASTWSLDNAASSSSSSNWRHDRTGSGGTGRETDARMGVG